jgi:hypothetical protein
MVLLTAVAPWASALADIERRRRTAATQPSTTNPPLTAMAIANPPPPASRITRICHRST